MKLSKKKLDEMIVLMQSPMYVKKIQDGELTANDLFSNDELIDLKWGDFYSLAKEIHKDEPIMYSMQRDSFYHYDKIWKRVHKSTRNEIHDIIRIKAGKDDYDLNNVKLPSIEKEIRLQADMFKSEDDIMHSTRYEKYVFPNGTLSWDIGTGEWDFIPSNEPLDQVREEDNPIFPFPFVDDYSGITNVFSLFKEWGISPKTVIHFIAYSIFFKKDFMNKMLYLVGSGSNGKSMMIKMIEALFPKKGITHLNISKLTGDKDGTGALEGSYMNISGEIKIQDFDSTFMKMITGGDSILVNPKNETPYSMIPRAKHVVSSNSYPHLRETTHGDLRRFLILEFNKTFEKDALFYEKRIKPYIPALFAYCLKVAKEIVVTGDVYIDQATLYKTREIIQDKSDVVYNFIGDFSIKGINNGDSIDARTLYRYFEKWNLANGRKTISSKNFIDRLDSHFGKESRDDKKLFLAYDRMEWEKFKVLTNTFI